MAESRDRVHKKFEGKWYCRLPRAAPIPSAEELQRLADSARAASRQVPNSCLWGALLGTPVHSLVRQCL